MTLSLQPLSFAEACVFVRDHHRHHLPPQGHRFSIGVQDGEKLVGCAIVGHPVARMLDDGWTAEVTRLCTDGTPHVASMLYAACWRAARAMGFRRLITYVLEKETGTSVRAAGWREIGKAGGGSWVRPNQPARYTSKHESQGPKTLWEMSTRVLP